MSGKSEEHHFGPGGQIVLIEYYEAAYLKDDIDNIRTLFTGLKDKLKAREEANRLAVQHERTMPHRKLFTTGRETANGSKSDEPESK
jgi:hypothetical protein